MPLQWLLQYLRFVYGLTGTRKLTDINLAQQTLGLLGILKLTAPNPHIRLHPYRRAYLTFQLYK